MSDAFLFHAAENATTPSGQDVGALTTPIVDSMTNGDSPGNIMPDFKAARPFLFAYIMCRRKDLARVAFDNLILVI